MTSRPFLDAVGPYAPAFGNALSDFGYGLSQGGFKNAFGIAAQRGAQMQPYRQAEVARKDQASKELETQNQTLAWLQKQAASDPRVATLLAGVESGGLTPADAFKTLMTPAQTQGSEDLSGTVQGRQQLAQQYGLDGDEAQAYVLTGKLPSSNQSVRAGVGQPIFGRNKTTGAVEPWQSMTDGSMINTANPDANPADYDFSPYTAAAERSAGTADAKSAATARTALPGAEQTVSITVQAIDDILGDKAGQAENFGNTMGIPNQMTPTMPGSAKANFWNKVQQAQGGAFLQARQWLKGQGAITETESAKAEGAMSLMENAARTGDQTAFQAAASDFRQAILDGYAKLQQAAAGDYAAGNVPGMQQQGGTDYRSKYGLE